MVTLNQFILNLWTDGLNKPLLISIDWALNYLIIFVILYLIVLLYFYFIPAGFLYYLFYIKRPGKLKSHKIQNKLPTKNSIKREIKSSLGSMVVFTLMGFTMFELWKSGFTKVYVDVSEHSIVYTILSFFLLLVLHDTYFYWMHRFMHWQPVYKYFHRLHHLSVTPTPWAVYAFQPLESFIQFVIPPLIIFIVPLHPAVIALFYTYNILVNTGGHSGHEFIPDWVKKHWLLKWNNSVTHHDLHHSKFNFNYQKTNSSIHKQILKKK